MAFPVIVNTADTQAVGAKPPSGRFVGYLLISPTGFCAVNQNASAAFLPAASRLSRPGGETNKSLGHLNISGFFT